LIAVISKIVSSLNDNTFFNINCTSILSPPTHYNIGFS
jgi:hypothetical protein